MPHRSTRPGVRFLREPESNFGKHIVLRTSQRSERPKPTLFCPAAWSWARQLEPRLSSCDALYSIEPNIPAALVTSKLLTVLVTLGRCLAFPDPLKAQIVQPSLRRHQQVSESG